MTITRRAPARPLILALIAAMALAILPAAAARPVLAASPDIVISEVYGGGGNSGATLTNDFIELFNRGSSAVSLNGWSVQYASTIGTTWSRTNLTNVTLAPRPVVPGPGSRRFGRHDTAAHSRYFRLDRHVSERGQSRAAQHSGHDRVVQSCAEGPTVVDVLGYGSATNCSESTPTANL